MSTFSKPSADAIIIHTSMSHSPVFTAEKITLQNIDEFYMGCLRFFVHKRILPHEKVEMVMWNLKHPGMQDWICVNYNAVSDLTFKEFIALLKTKFLKKGWQNQIHQKVIRLQGSQNFWE
ncbi:hypothetical protein Hypma_008153 [Hypsizygus marmoreus]|uniref:Retrotransposon gag domain-containing protein n=1 Tax=Hypsizygus marmoreus TaxID=39966 RepID=A0A369JTL5_HYPMA|nr:hypothetical protein Hypma_008153 [Hypsizygus marmoreus]